MSKIKSIYSTNRTFSIGQNIDTLTTSKDGNSLIITRIEEVNEIGDDGIIFQGYQLWSNSIRLAWVPLHAIEVIYYKV